MTDGTADADYYKGAQEAASSSTISRTSRRQETRDFLTPNADALIIVMVGLPARGKSFISRKLERFLLWKGFKTRMFNVGKYRRDAEKPETSGRSDFFDAQNTSALAAREAAAGMALDDVLAYLDRGGQRAIFDATNTTRERRARLLSKIRHHSARYEVIFLEVICQDPEVLDANMQNKVLHSPDFSGMSYSDALADLKTRISKYEAVYETVEDGEGSYIKLYDLSSKLMAKDIYGSCLKSVIPFLAGIHVGSRPIWLVRAFPGEVNPEYPGNSDQEFVLSPYGQQLGDALVKFLEERGAVYWETCGKPREQAYVVTSTVARAVASVSCMPLKPKLSSALNPIDKGTIGAGWWEDLCSGPMLPWGEVEQRHPEFMARWMKDPLHCRFPGGENYMDVINRLETLLLDVEMCTRPVLLVSHLSVIQVLCAYFRGLPVEEFWKIEVPKGVVLELTPSLGGGYVYEEHPLAVRGGSGKGKGYGSRRSKGD
eukprot:TRINITY_DN109455_c0_g1_i1.p1 TRINITY_DN109455_c0_g1~~TRINITY_DN109455_c0_g1_i1.p1  ORF type:complete len:486 (+),score=90.54 TRINITY_DN109455_c0_g1_i1:65-1522(+)